MPISGPPEDCGLVVVGDQILLATVDLMPVVGTDMFAAGRIATLHACSDIYASGGSPGWGLVVLVTEPDVSGATYEVLLGGVLQAADDEGLVIVGGHSLVGAESMIGLSVLGRPPNGHVLSRYGAALGDSLLLSKPLGSGLAMQGFRLGLLSDSDFQEAMRVMTTSNKEAAGAALSYGVSACIDVTGFGLLGHLSEILPVDCGARLSMSSVPKLNCLEQLPNSVADTVWIRNNYEYATRNLELDGSPREIAVLLDPQTNGGLLVAARPQSAELLVKAGFAHIGEVTTGRELRIAQ